MRLLIEEVWQGQATHVLAAELGAQALQLGGLREARRYRFAVTSEVPLVAYVDEKRLVPLPRDNAWLWDSGFCIGTVRLELTSLQGDVLATVLLDIASDDKKLGTQDLRQLLDDLLRLAPEKIAGDSQAFLSLDARGDFAAQVLYQRLRHYGPLFCDAVDACRNHPHTSFEAVTRQLPIDRVRRPSRRAMCAPRVIAYGAAMAAGHHERAAPLVGTSRLASTIDTLANRCLLTLTRKVLHLVRSLQQSQHLHMQRVDEMDASRSLRRIQVLDALAASLRVSVAWLIAAGVGQGQDLADGLAQMAPMPAYARALRLAKLACSSSFGKSGSHDAELPLNSSWGMYEQWCFEYTRLLLESLVGVAAKNRKNMLGAGSDAYVFQLRDRTITLAAQVTFSSGACALAGTERRSLSGERRPDMLLIVDSGTDMQWYIFDAKYRQSKANVLDAMTSAHIYRDSLLLQGKRCSRAILLTPGASFDGRWEMFTAAHWNTFGTGAVADFRPEAPGLEVLADFIADACNGQAGDAERHAA